MIDVDWSPSVRKLRWFAVLQVGFFAVLAAIVYHRGGQAIVPAALIAAALLAGVLIWLWPAFGRRVYLGWMLAGYPIGWLVSHAILAGVFYLGFTPLGIVLRLCGHDPLRRRFDRGASSYWVPRAAPEGTDRYFRQF